MSPKDVPSFSGSDGSSWIYPARVPPKVPVRANPAMAPPPTVAKTAFNTDFFVGKNAALFIECLSGGLLFHFQVWFLKIQSIRSET